MKDRFTFKKQPLPTGRYRSFSLSRATDIKLEKKDIGYIGYEDCLEKEYPTNIHFKVKKEATKEEPCKWRWYTLKYTATSEQDAREFVNKYFKEITTKLDLYMGED